MMILSLSYFVQAIKDMLNASTNHHLLLELMMTLKLTSKVV